MPVAKFKTIREASSEDSIHKALNIITPLPGKKWKTKTCGLQSAYIILELEEELQITGVDIGNEHSAFIEVMVSNTGCSPNDFVDLLITCSFMTPIESKNSVNTNRVRCFAQEALVKETLKEKWKFLKVICTQPFNKHVQYGLSFVKLYVVDPNVVNEKKVLGSIESEQNKKIVKFVFREESPESESTLFDRWKQQSNTISRSDLHLDAGKKTESSLEELKQDSSGKKVRNFVTNKQTQIKETIKVPKLMRNNDSVEFNKNYDTPQYKRERAKDTSSKDLKTVQKNNCFKNTSNTSSIKKTTAVAREYRHFNQLLRGVVLVISGIQNPDRSNIRSKALAMGAKYRPNWEKDSTHLICQFKNTPKYNQVLGKGKIVSREWIENCHKEKKYLPWRRFALDSVEASKEESDEEIFCESLKQENVDAEANRFATSESNAFICKNNSDHSSSLDTDDEIQLVAKKYKRSDSFEASTDEETYLNQKLIDEINSKSY